MSRVLAVEVLNIIDRYEVMACVIILEHVIIVYICLANSAIILYSFLIQNTHFGTKVY